MNKVPSSTRVGRENTSQAMSRSSMSKSRAEKTRTVTVAPLVQVTVDIVPGQFTEDDWMLMVNVVEGDYAVGEIVEILLSCVMDECYKVYLARQRIPYTISQARDAMVQIIEGRFLARDEGEADVVTDISWQEEEEPQTCTTDSCAQGCVPIIQPVLTPRSKHTQLASEEPITETLAQEAAAAEFEPLLGPTPEPPSPSLQPAPSSTDQTPELGEVTEQTQKGKATTKTSQLLLQPILPPKPPKTKREYRPHRGPLRSAGLKNITKSLEKTEKEMFVEQLVKMEEEDEEDVSSFNLLPTCLHNILKIQLGRPPQKRDVIYDDAGNVLSMPKLDPSRLPRHYVRPQVEVLDPNKEAECKVKEAVHRGGPAASQRLKQGRRPKKKEDLGLSEISGFQLISTPSGSQKLMLDGKTFNPYTSTTAGGIRGHLPLSAAIVLDTMQLSHGVILRESNNTERGSLHSLRQKEQGKREEGRELQPVRASVALPSISVDQLIKNHVPQVRPIATFPSS
ncbi:uncharacterized protein C2orf81 homolog [Ascaphus truei]|uniref:uncharacterized protein C2orf81 homolog n=1 Tax=Ascaphus truei TaxID=8439 RepID=UPI003F5AD8D6